MSDTAQANYSYLLTMPDRRQHPVLRAALAAYRRVLSGDIGVVLDVWPHAPKVGPETMASVDGLLRDAGLRLAALRLPVAEAQQRLLGLDGRLMAVSADAAELTFDQADGSLLQSALDLYLRLHMGQFKEAASILRYQANTDCQAVIGAAERVLAWAKSVVTPLRGGSYYSLHGPDTAEAGKVAGDLNQVLRHRLAHDANPNGGWQVDFDVPLPAARGVALAWITRRDAAPGPASVPA